MIHGVVASAALHLAYVGPVRAALIGELLLAEAKLVALGADPVPERLGCG